VERARRLEFFFANVDLEEPIAQPDPVDFDGTIHVPMHVRNTVDLKIRDRDGRDMKINAELRGLQIDSTDKNNRQIRSLRWRIVVSPDQAADLARFWKEDKEWNHDHQTLASDNVGAGVLARIEVEETYRPEEDPEKYVGYRGAVADLEWAIGGYCSYCEAKRQDSVTCDVEHRIPKSWYPSERLRWDNFLFACRVCNSTYKGAKPGRGFGIRNAIRSYPLNNKPLYQKGLQAPIVPGSNSRVPYDELVQACNDYVAWPSLDDQVPRAANTTTGTNTANTNTTGANTATANTTGTNPTTTNTANTNATAASATGPTNYSLLCFSYKLCEWDTVNDAQLRAIPVQDLLDPRTQDGKDDDASDTVVAPIWDAQLSAVRQMHVRVIVEARSPATGDQGFNDRKRDAASETIRITGLNNVASAFGDRRTMERTHAWLRAVKSVRSLIRMQARLTDPNDKDLVDGAWEAAATSVELGGYYSTWLTVFKRAGDACAKTLAETLDARHTALGRHVGEQPRANRAFSRWACLRPKGAHPSAMTLRKPSA
jgi:5-methylcytosine-specific restriction endonuclease McrA